MPRGTGGLLQADHVICPGCSHNFTAVSQTSQDNIAALRALLQDADSRLRELGDTTLAPVRDRIWRMLGERTVT
jgi:hypothetical protein